MQIDLTPTALPFPRVVWAILRHPTQAFTNIASYPSRKWLIPAILLMLLVAASGYLNQNLIMKQVIDSPPAGAPFLLPSIGSTMLLWVKWLVWAGLLYVASTLFGGNSNFRTLWRVIVWASLPELIRSILQIIYLLFAQQPIEYAGLSGLILRGAEDPAGIQLAIAGILAQLDLFALWKLGLLAIGVACATGLAQRKAWVVILIVWGLLTALGLIPAQLTSYINMSIS